MTLIVKKNCCRNLGIWNVCKIHWHNAIHATKSEGSSDWMLWKWYGYNKLYLRIFQTFLWLTLKLFAIVALELLGYSSIIFSIFCFCCTVPNIIDLLSLLLLFNVPVSWKMFSKIFQSKILRQLNRLMYNYLAFKAKSAIRTWNACQLSQPFNMLGSKE